MQLGIKGRKSVARGASRGLGRACAQALAEEGVDVTIVARTRDVLEQTAGEISKATGVTVTPVVGDIANAGRPRCRAQGLPRSRYPGRTTPTAPRPAISASGRARRLDRSASTP